MLVALEEVVDAFAVGVEFYLGVASVDGALGVGGVRGPGEVVVDELGGVAEAGFEPPV